MKKYIDTNVFLYAFLNQDSHKKLVSVKMLTQAVWEGSGWISLQVVKEFSNVMVKKSTKALPEILSALEIFKRFNLVQESLLSVRRALEIRDKYQLQFYDSLMLAAAERAGCDEIYTEDLNNGQFYCGIKAINPFLERAA